MKGIVYWLVLAVAPDPASVPTAEDTIAEAAALVGEERFDEARALLERAYATDPHPALLYARAQVERRAGQCEEARRLFEQFAADASKEDAHDALRLSEACTPSEADPATEITTPEEPIDAPTEDKAPTDAPTVSPAAEPEQQSERPSDSSEGPPVDDRTWQRHPAPITLMAVGLGSSAAGIGLLVHASIRPPAPAEASNEGGYDDDVRAHRTRFGVGVALTAVGGALVVGAATTWGLMARKHRRQRATLTGSGVAIAF